MLEVTTYEARAKLCELLGLVDSLGMTIVVTKGRDKRPVARISPVNPPQKKKEDHGY